MEEESFCADNDDCMLACSSISKVFDGIGAFGLELADNGDHMLVCSMFINL